MSKLTRVHALMVTQRGRDALSRLAFRSFLSQTVKDKILIVVGTDGHVPPWVEGQEAEGNVLFIPADEGMSLGQMRNLGLASIPKGALWCCWDDDDYSHDDRMQVQMNSIENFGLTHCYFRNVLAYDFEEDKAWRKTTKNGIPGTVMGINDPMFHYSDRKRSEDVSFKKLTYSKGVARAIHNQALLYTRLIHGGNTWHREFFKLNRFKPHERRDLDEEAVGWLSALLTHYEAAGYTILSPDEPEERNTSATAHFEQKF